MHVTTTLSRPLAQDIAAATLRELPEFFVTDVLGSPIYSKQIEMARAVQAHRRVSVVGCNSSGKDYMAARLVLWWMNTRHPARALVYGPTTRQVDGIVFSEMRASFSTAPAIDGYKMKGRIYETSNRGYEVSKESVAIGFATNATPGADGQVFNLQGFHSPNLLVILTEAHAITQAEYDAVLRLQPARVLMTGNAFVQSGPFYDAFYDKSEDWHQIHIDAWDTPNLNGGDIPGMVTQEAIDEAEREWGIDSPLYQGSIMARFPDNLEDMLCPLHDVNAAASRTAPEDAPGQPRIAGLDVAGPGTDKTVLIFRQGPQVRYLWRGHEPNTMTTARRALDISLKERVQYLVVDDAGIGGRVVERMRLILAEEPLYKAIHVIAFNGGAKARNSRFFNANAEIYWRTRLWLNEQDSSIPNDRLLMGQLTARKYDVNPKNQIVVESKRDMRKRGLSKSPDEADALAMTHAIRIRESTNTEAGARKESLWTG